MLHTTTTITSRYFITIARVCSGVFIQSEMSDLSFGVQSGCKVSGAKHLSRHSCQRQPLCQERRLIACQTKYQRYMVDL